MNTEGWECKGCGRLVFYDWPTFAGDSRDDYYFHVSCFYLGGKIETPIQSSDTKQLPLWEAATS